MQPLFRAGCCERLLEGDMSLRDNGEIRKLKMLISKEEILMLSNYFLFQQI